MIQMSTLWLASRCQSTLYLRASVAWKCSLSPHVLSLWPISVHTAAYLHGYYIVVQQLSTPYLQDVGKTWQLSFCRLWDSVSSRKMTETGIQISDVNSKWIRSMTVEKLCSTTCTEYAPSDVIIRDVAVMLLANYTCSTNDCAASILPSTEINRLPP